MMRYNEHVHFILHTCVHVHLHVHVHVYAHVQSMGVARGVRGHGLPGKFLMDSLRHILAHSQPNIMMGRLFTRTP